MLYASKRQTFLIDQGYSFKVVTDLVNESTKDLLLETKSSQLELLSQVVAIPLAFRSPCSCCGIGDGMRQRQRRSRGAAGSRWGRMLP